jgi:DNA-binding transcriptional regulator YhcF (GntR family)
MPKGQGNSTKELAEELDIFNNTLDYLVDLFEEKGIVTYKKWKQCITKKLKKSRESISYRELEFGEE